MESTQMSLIYPLVAMVFLSFIVTAKMFISRVRDMKANKIHPQSIPQRADLVSKFKDTRCADNYMNLFEAPVIFYVICILFLILKKGSSISIGLMWAYVFARYIHSYIHCTYNKVMHRFYAFASSMFLLMALFINLVLTIFA